MSLLKETLDCQLYIQISTISKHRELNENKTHNLIG